MTSRLFDIIRALLVGPHGREKLARQARVTERQMVRDIAALQAIGVPLVVSGVGPSSVVSLDRDEYRQWVGL